MRIIFMGRKVLNIEFTLIVSHPQDFTCLKNNLIVKSGGGEFELWFSSFREPINSTKLQSSKLRLWKV